MEFRMSDNRYAGCKSLEEVVKRAQGGVCRVSAPSPVDQEERSRLVRALKRSRERAYKWRHKVTLLKEAARKQGVKLD